MRLGYVLRKKEIETIRLAKEMDVDGNRGKEDLKLDKWM